jgi:hypothetical protein
MFKCAIILSVLLSQFLLSYSKPHKVYGTVRSDEGHPVAFCVVKAVNSSSFTESNERGEFLLEYDRDSSHSLMFYSLGFETKEIRILSDTLRIVLKRRVNKMDDVVVAASHNKKKVRHGLMGKRNLKPMGIITGFLGNEDAIFLGADSSRHGILENIYYYIADGGLPHSKFRVHVYDIDTGYMPGNDLLDSVVILHGNEGNEWVAVNVQSRNIPVGRGLFISMEWISGYGNDLRLVTSKKYPRQPPFQGQILAATEGYYKQFSLYYIRKNTKSPWRYYVSAGTAKRNILNPMIYATYTYRKK